MCGFSLAISCCFKISNISSKFVKYTDVSPFKAVTIIVIYILQNRQSNINGLFGKIFRSVMVMKLRLMQYTSFMDVTLGLPTFVENMGGSSSKFSGGVGLS